MKIITKEQFDSCKAIMTCDACSHVKPVLLDVFDPQDYDEPCGLICKDCLVKAISFFQ